MTGHAGRNRHFLREGCRQWAMRLMTLAAIDALHVVAVPLMTVKAGRQMIVRLVTLVAIEGFPVSGRSFVHLGKHIIMTAAADVPDILDRAEVGNFRTVRIVTPAAIVEGKMGIIVRDVATGAFCRSLLGRRMLLVTIGALQAFPMRRP